MAGISRWEGLGFKGKVVVVIAGCFVFLILWAIFDDLSGKNKPPVHSGQTANQPSTAPSTARTSAATTRPVYGTPVTVASGTYTGGKEIATGLYDVTVPAGEGGTFYVSGKDSYNEILGNASPNGGVPKIRAQISNGDQIQITGLGSVTFTPVSSPYVTAHSAVTLYAGTFTVGQDVGVGSYLVTPGSGQTGTFDVSGVDTYNEILGGVQYGGSANATVYLSSGDTVAVSGLSQVLLTPQQ